MEYPSVRMIRTYAADGSRRRDYSATACERMAKLGMVALQKNRYGEPISATFLPEAKDSQSSLNPLRRSIPTGVYYSFEELVAERFWVWTHRPLISRAELREMLGPALQDERIAAEDFLKTVFLAVPLSLFEKRKPSRTPASRAAVACSVGEIREKALQRNWKRPKRRKQPRVLSGA